MGGPGAGAGLGSGRVGRRLGAEAPQLVVRAGGSVRGPRRGGMIAGRWFAGRLPGAELEALLLEHARELGVHVAGAGAFADRTSTRLNSSHVANSYAVFCLTKQK